MGSSACAAAKRPPSGVFARRDPRGFRSLRRNRPATRSVVEIGVTGGTCVACSDRAVAAAPERESLALLPSGPDAVRTLPVRGTRSSTPRAQTLSRRTVPRTAFGPAWSGFRVQGTADSPPSAAGQAEGTTSSRLPSRRPVIDATLYTDAGCPWAYSANPALRVLEWRFRDQLSWRLVMIGLREEPSEAAIRTFDGERALARWRVFEERYGMPFATEPKERPAGTGRGCRAVVAAGMLEPGSEWTVFRALQIANFASRSTSTTPTASARPSSRRRRRRGRHRRELDDDGRRRRVRAPARGGTIRCGHARARRRTRRRRRTGACASLRRRSCSDAARRRSSREAGSRCSPTTRCSRTSRPTLERVPPPESPAPLLEFFPGGLTTAEVALLLAEGSDPIPDRGGAVNRLTELGENGRAVRTPLGTDALWARPA